MALHRSHRLPTGGVVMLLIACAPLSTAASFRLRVPVAPCHAIENSS